MYLNQKKAWEDLSWQQSKPHKDYRRQYLDADRSIILATYTQLCCLHIYFDDLDWLHGAFLQFLKNCLWVEIPPLVGPYYLRVSAQEAGELNQRTYGDP